MIRNEDVATMVRRRIREVRERMAEAAGQACRDVASIRLVAVSKYHPVSAMVAAALEGVDILGENRVQEALAKRPAWEAEFRHRGVPQPWTHGISWAIFSETRQGRDGTLFVHPDVDSIRLGEELSRSPARTGRRFRCCSK
jgi:hypothetical protein